MIRYVLLFLLMGALFAGLSTAWSQDSTGKANQPAGDIFTPKDKDPEQKKEEDKVIFRELPELKLKGMLKLKGKEDPTALLEVDGKEIYRVRKGDTISVTIPGENVVRQPKEVPQPVQLPAGQQPGQPGQQPKAPAGTQANQTGQPGQPGQPGSVGVVTKPSPKINLKKVQIVLKIVEINRHGLAIEASPMNERILVR